MYSLAAGWGSPVTTSQDTSGTLWTKVWRKSLLCTPGKKLSPQSWGSALTLKTDHKFFGKYTRPKKATTPKLEQMWILKNLGLPVFHFLAIHHFWWGQTTVLHWAYFHVYKKWTINSKSHLCWEDSLWWSFWRDWVQHYARAHGRDKFNFCWIWYKRHFPVLLLSTSLSLNQPPHFLPSIARCSTKHDSRAKGFISGPHSLFSSMNEWVTPNPEDSAKTHLQERLTAGYCALGSPSMGRPA